MENNEDFPDDLRDIDITDIGEPEDVDMAELLDNLVEGIVLSFMFRRFHVLLPCFE